MYGQASTEMRALLHYWEVAYPPTLGPEDHIATELRLMAALAERSGITDAQTAAHLAECQIQLLHDRLLSWIPAFATQVQAQTNRAFYAALVVFVEQFLRGDAAYLRAQLMM